MIIKLLNYLLKHLHVSTFVRRLNNINSNKIILIMLLTILIIIVSWIFYFNKNVNSDKLTILFCGDMAFGENYQIHRKENILKTRGYDFSLTNFKKIMLSSDMVIVNLETPITDIKKSPYDDVKKYVHWSDVKLAPKYLKKYKINNVALANNHLMDFSTEGMKQTFEILKNNNINYFGAGLTEQEAAKPLIKELIIGKQKFRLAVISAFYYRKSYEHKYNAYAKDHQGGINRLSIEKIAEQIKQLKQEDPNTFVVMFPHWGLNYKRVNMKEQIIANNLVEKTGVDLIIGHGAHMIQKIDLYKDCWIVFNLGNFVFNSSGRYDDFNVLPYSAIAQLTIENRFGKLNKSLKVYPIYSNNLKVDYKPRFLTRQEFNAFKNDQYKYNPKFKVLEKKLNLLSTGKDKYGYYYLIKDIE